MTDNNLDILIQPVQRKESIDEGPGAFQKISLEMVRRLCDNFFALKSAACETAPDGEVFSIELTATVTAGLQLVIVASSEGGIHLSAECKGTKKSTT